MLAKNVPLEDFGSDMLVLSANTFFIAVSVGLETVRPEIGTM
jgi:hypothetical protein